MLILRLGVAAATPDTRDLAMGLIMVSSFFIGWNESVTLSLSGIELLDQREIGTAVGGNASQLFPTQLLVRLRISLIRLL